MMTLAIIVERRELMITYDSFMAMIRRQNPNEPEFVQAVDEFAQVIIPFVQDHPIYQKEAILERLIEPDRWIAFRVSWIDDQDVIHVNRGYRIQFNNAIGPYKGGLRFHPTVNSSILKFLGFEQILKNSLTTMPLGGAKGGADFDPKGKSNREIMRFCQAYMTELYQHIGPDLDVPAGDIGVGEREIGYLYGQYKRLSRDHTGAMTGKPLSFGGSHVRKEATGYGCVYFVEHVLKQAGDGLEGKKCLISGSGNVALYTAEKLIEKGATVITLSDSSGTVVDPEGITQEQLEWIKDLKFNRQGRIREFAEEFGVRYLDGQKPWGIPGDIAFPSATQNEITEVDAESLVKNGCFAVGEGANMPTTKNAVEVFERAHVLYGPAKAANAGGVAISALEMSQNSMRLRWNWAEIDRQLQQIMYDIHQACVEYGRSKPEEPIDYRKGANLAGFVKVADAMVSYGVS
jgi:glutamate dehydrogenase (NADP+)